MSTIPRTLLPLLVLFLGGTSAFLLMVFKRETQPEPIQEAPPLVRVVNAEPAPHQFIVQSQGAVAPLRVIQLVTEIPGRVVSVSPSLAAGGFFEKGESLIKIDPRDYELARIRAAAQVTQAQLRLTQEEAEASIALQEWKELGHNQGEPPPLLLRKPQMAQARAALEAAQAELKKAELDLSRTEIKAPFPGRVWEKKVDVGQYVTPGATLGRLYSVDAAEVRLPISLPDLAYLDLPLDYKASPQHPAPQVRLHASIARETNTWQGEIVRIEGEIDPGSRMITLVAQITDPYNRTQSRPNTSPLPVGLFVDAEILGRSVDNTFSLPRTALRGRNEVIIVDSENRLRFRKVEVLRSNRQRVIIGSGLNAGDRISISLMDAPSDGKKVRVDKPSAHSRSLPSHRSEEMDHSHLTLTPTVPLYRLL